MKPRFANSWYGDTVPTQQLRQEIQAIYDLLGKGSGGEIEWPLAAPNGSSASPSYGFENSPSSGIRFSSDDDMVLQADRYVLMQPQGTVRVRAVNPSGNYNALQVADDAGVTWQNVWNNGNLPIESGTVNVSLSSTATAPSSVTYTQRAFYYVRVGPIVVFSGRIATSAVTGGTGDIRITGLPYACIAMHTIVSHRSANLPLRDSGGNPTPLYVYLVSNSSSIAVGYQSHNSGATALPLSQWGANGDLYIAGSYMTND